MKKKYFLILSIFISVLSFAQPPEGDAHPGDYYGSRVKVQGAILLADLAGQLESGSIFSETKIMGKVVDVCPKAGCWIKLELPDGK